MQQQANGNARSHDGDVGRDGGGGLFGLGVFGNETKAGPNDKEAPFLGDELPLYTDGAHVAADGSKPGGPPGLHVTWGMLKRARGWPDWLRVAVFGQAVRGVEERGRWRCWAIDPRGCMWVQTTHGSRRKETVQM